MPTELTDYSNILIELIKAVKMHNFYPEGHPQLDSALDKCYLLIKKYVDVRGEIKWKVDLKGIYDGKTLIVGSAEFALLAKKLFFRRIKELTFTPRITTGDLRLFLNVVKFEPEELQAKGGAEALFAERDASGILLNEMRYEDLKRLKKELEEKKKDQEKAVEAERKKKEEEAGEAKKAAEEEKAKPKEEVKEDTLAELVEKIKGERDHLRYNDLAVRIKEKTNILIIEKKFDEAFPVLQVFYEDLPQSLGLSNDIRAVALDSLKAFLTREMMLYLVKRVGLKDEPFRGQLQQMLILGGADAAELLLDAIIGAKEAITRRFYFNALAHFGKKITPQVEARLQSPEWYVIRQMISLLGEIGDPQAIEAIENAYNHPDVRVKKEVLKSLVKLSTPRATGFLLNTLNEKDPSLVTQAIISLGALKDASAVDILGEIALRRSVDNTEQRKEAIKALGMIGSPVAVPYLTKILFKKVWFGKRANDEMRSLAAYSLGMIGSPEAYDEVEKAYPDSSGELSIALRKTLEGRGRTNERNG